MTGKLYGVGVGPGDPGLVTRKAWGLIETARVIAYPRPDTGDSFARSVVAEAISADAEEIPLTVPMRVERFPAQDIYEKGAERIAERLGAGVDVVVLCEGDPFLYGSFMYLHARLAARYECEVVPGVTSLTTVAAALGRPLGGRNDIVTLLPATLSEAELEAGIAGSQAVAIMKLGRHMPKVRGLLHRLGLTEHTGYVSHASLPHQIVHPLCDAPERPPYFSMLLIYKGADPWLTRRHPR